jgi:antitoxin component YwqK of YwqJK toxin-antitoxin module
VIDKLFTGEWKYYHQASKIVMTLENYKNGKLEGLRSVYYQSGKIAEEISYLNNIKNGLYKFFRRMELYLNNQFTRTMNTMAATFKDAQGNVVSKDYFKRKKSGIWQFYKWKVSQRDQHDYTWDGSLWAIKCSTEQLL